MAHPTIVNQESGSTWFTLSNNPQLMCVMDTVDYVRLVKNTKRWYIHTSKKSNIKQFSYIRCTLIDGSHEHLHREVMRVGDYSLQSVVDHKNDNGLDCRRENLREVDHFQNITKNRKAKHSYKGFSISEIHRPNRIVFQSYRKSEYIAYGKTLDAIKSRIDEYIIKEMN